MPKQPKIAIPDPVQPVTKVDANQSAKKSSMEERWKSSLQERKQNEPAHSKHNERKTPNRIQTPFLESSQTPAPISKSENCPLRPPVTLHPKSRQQMTSPLRTVVNTADIPDSSKEEKVLVPSTSPKKKRLSPATERRLRKVLGMPSGGTFHSADVHQFYDREIRKDLTSGIPIPPGHMRNKLNARNVLMSAYADIVTP